MAQVEFNSFVSKFNHLWFAGFNATLTIEAVDGEASVCLKSSLGSIQPHLGSSHHGQQVRQRGPAYRRRQERRQAARTAGVVAGQAEYPTTKEVKDQSPPAARACEGNQTKTAKEANLSSEIVSDTAEKVVEDEKYSGTEKYWKSGILGTCFQYFLDANEILDICVLDVEVLNLEKLKVFQARKCAFGDDFKYYPPWRK